jgi:hypothetical protein
MKTIVRIGCVSGSALATAAGALLLGNQACTTAEVNDAGGAGSSSGSSGAGSTSSSEAGGSSSSSSGGGASSSSGGSAGADGGADGSTPATICFPPTAPASGPTLLPPANARIQAVPADAGVDGGPFNVQWGTFTPFGAGTFFYPNDNGLPAGPGTDNLANDAGNACATLGSQNSYVAAYTLATNTWQLSGTVASYAGIGMYLSPCQDAHLFSGVKFTVSGDVGNEAAAGDAGTGGEMQFMVFQASNVLASDAGVGACTANCNPSIFTFPVTSADTEISVRWTDLTGGTPNDTVDSPGQITQLQWQYIWPCTATPTPFTTNVTIRNIQFLP